MRKSLPLDSDRLLAFVTVVRESGFSRAAVSLGKTQSAVSQAVLLLERELGQKLMIRDGRKSRVTEAGNVLFEHAERVLREMSAAREHLAGLTELRSGRLVIGASDTLSCYLLPPVFAAFRQRHPGIELRLDNRPSPATAIEVAEGRVDVGVIALPLPAISSRGRPLEERLRVEPIGPYDDVVICQPAHPLALRKRLGVAELGGVPLLLLDRTTGTRSFLEAAFDAAQVHPEVQMEMSSVEVLKRLVELGFGVSVVPALSVEREVMAGSLARIALVEARGRRRVGIVTAVSGPVSRAAAAFVETARAELST
jgi:DNA-binding transcriptional LysR family regulator